MVCVQYRNTTLPLGFADTTAKALPFVTDRDMHPAFAFWRSSFMEGRDTNQITKTSLKPADICKDVEENN